MICIIDVDGRTEVCQYRRANKRQSICQIRYFVLVWSFDTITNTKPTADRLDPHSIQMLRKICLCHKNNSNKCIEISFVRFISEYFVLFASPCMTIEMFARFYQFRYFKHAQTGDHVTFRHFRNHRHADAVHVVGIITSSALMRYLVCSFYVYWTIWPQMLTFHCKCHWDLNHLHIHNI